MRFKLINDIGIVFLILVSGVCLAIEHYELTIVSFSLLLLFGLVTRQSLNTKIIFLFLFFYYFIPFWNISNYRGTIEFETLRIYTLANFAIIVPLLFTFGNNFFKETKKEYSHLRVSKLFTQTVLVHLAIVYLLLAYVYATLGNVLVYQELRFYMSPIISYLIKSTLYIPIFVLFFSRNQFTKKNILFFIILPLLPPFLIGSRGTVVIIVIAVILLFLLKSFGQGNKYYLNQNKAWKKNKYKIYLSGGIIFLLIQITYYTRRMFSDMFLSTEDLAMRYFGSAEWYYILIMPIYFSFRETVGITNRIIEKGTTNDWFEYPMFFAEVFTILPGKQESPGIALSKGLYTTSEYAGGITPGVIGGLYIDYRLWLIPILLVISFIIYILYKKSTNSDMYKVLYVITLAQFFHLYHRGFFKPEYLVAYGIILFYIYISNLNWKNQGQREY